MIKYSLRPRWNVNWEFCLLSNGETIYKWLVALIAQEYRQRNYPDHFMMPSVRKLSNYLSVKRHLVERAYRHWIKRKEILYTLDRVGTFMFKYADERLDIAVARHAQFPFNLQPLINSTGQEHQLTNILTLGSTYRNQYLNILALSRKDVSLNAVSIAKSQVSWFSDEALQLLKKRELIHNEQQFCIIPDGKALYKVLKTITSPEDMLVITSRNDSQVIDAAGPLRLNLSFCSSDDQGMSATQLEELCKQKTVKVVLVRPGPDFPIPVCMEVARWEQIVHLSERYGFCILVLDEDAEFRSVKCPSLPISLRGGHVIYLSPFSKVSPVLQKIGMVAGPEDFIASLIHKTKKIVFGWDRSTEKALLGALSRSELSAELEKSIQACKMGAFSLNLLFRNYLEDYADLIFPGCGTFAVLKFNMPLKELPVARFQDHSLYQEGENFSFDPQQPIDLIRISLFIEDWTSVEFSLKMILKSLGQE